MKKICLDAGHYKNYNPSPVFPSYYEGNKMWELCKLVKDYLLENYEVEIKLTRSDLNKDLEVYKRGQLAKGCDGFYSFHSNSTDKESVDRVVIIRQLNKTSLDSFCKEIGDTIKSVMGVKQNTQVYEKSYNGGEYYGVLRGTKAVGVTKAFILEHSFHTNLNASKWLYNSSNLKKLAEKEAQVIAKFHNLPSKKKIPSMIKIIKEVNYRNTPNFSDDKYIVGKAKEGEVFTVVDRVKSNTSTDMYKLKSGNYITTSTKYVVEYKK